MFSCPDKLSTEVSACGWEAEWVGRDRDRDGRDTAQASTPTASMLSNERETIAYLGDRGSGFHAKFVKTPLRILSSVLGTKSRQIGDFSPILCN